MVVFQFVAHENSLILMMEIYSWQLSLSDGFDWTPYFYYLFNRNSSNSLHFCFCFSSPLSLCSGTKLDTSWVTHMEGLFVGCVTHNFWCGGGEHGCIATNHSHVVSHPPPPVSHILPPTTHFISHIVILLSLLSHGGYVDYKISLQFLYPNHLDH